MVLLLMKEHYYYLYAPILTHLIYQFLAFLYLNNIKIRNVQMEGGKYFSINI